MTLRVEPRTHLRADAARCARACNELAARVDKPAILLPEIVPLGAMDDSETAALFDVDSPCSTALPA